MRKEFSVTVAALSLVATFSLPAAKAEAQGPPRVCDRVDSSEPTGKVELKVMQSDSSGAAVDFGGERNRQADKVILDAVPAGGVQLPEVLAANVVELRRDKDQSIENFSAAAIRQGGRYTLEVCVDPKESAKAGTYTGNVLFASQNISSAPIPITVRLQYKHTYLLQFATLVTGLLGTAWGAATIERSAGKTGAGKRTRKRLWHWTVITAAAPAVAAAWLVWKNASEDEAFGRGSGAIVGHLAAQIGPAVAAAVTAFFASAADK